MVISMIDDIDRALLSALQKDASLSVDELSERGHLSRNACGRRIKRLEEEGIIRARVALLDAAKLNLGLTAFIAVRTAHHEANWLDQISAAGRALPDVER